MKLFGFGKREQSIPSPSLSPQQSIQSKPWASSLLKKEEKPVEKIVEKPTGIFGGKSYRTFKDVKNFAYKSHGVKLKGFNKLAYKSEQKEAAKRLQDYSRKYFHKETINERNWGDVDRYKKENYSLLGKLSREAEKAKREGKFKVAKAIKRDIEIFRSWKKGS